MTLRTERIRTLDQVRAFLDGNQPADFELTDRTSAYAFVRRTLARFEYHGLRKPDKGLVRRFVEKVTGFSRAQTNRLIAQHRRTGNIRDHRCKPPANAFPAPLHPLRRRPAGRGRRGLRPALRTRHQGDPLAHVPCLRRRALRAARLHLQRPHLQPPQDPAVPHRPPHLPQDPAHTCRHRTPPQAPAQRQARPSARRHRPPRRPRWQEGDLPHQRR